jgi:hypothetical protein
VSKNRRRKRSNLVGTLVLIAVPFVVVAVGFEIARRNGAFARTHDVPDEEVLDRRLKTLEALSVEAGLATERLELSDAGAEMFLKEENGKLDVVLRARVKYRVVAGSPPPTVFHAVEVKLDNKAGRELVRGVGPAFPTSGDLTVEFKPHFQDLSRKLAQLRAAGAKEFRPEPGLLPTTATFEVKRQRMRQTGIVTDVPAATPIVIQIPQKEAYPLP